jgi:hypothetical protein
MINSGALETDLWMKSLTGVVLQSKDETSSYVSSYKAKSRRGGSKMDLMSRKSG